MNELKPVAWMQQQGAYSEPCTWEIDDGMAARGWRQEPLYAIPDTHRVVSVEFLKVVAMIVTEARDYYSDMNDNVCQSYADPWEHAADACKELRAIIDNKEQS